MRLLFDEQLSEELITAVHDLFPDSLHVRLLGKGGAADPIIWQLARERGCVLVTKDEDFHRLSVLRGAPPKVVWLRTGGVTLPAHRDAFNQVPSPLGAPAGRTLGRR